MNVYSALLHSTLTAMIILAMPLLCVVTVVGIAIAVLQAVTSVQDQNAAVLPKLGVATICIAAAGPTGMNLVITLFKHCVAAIPAIVASAS